MGYVGEIISLGVACLWTVAALASEVASKKLGVFVMNVWRMALALLFSAVLIWIFTGYPYPAFAQFVTWAWLLASGVVGYFFGDWCLFNSYLTIGSRFGQLFMTLAPAFTALCAWGMIGQTLSWQSLLAMVITLSGIAVSVLGHDNKHHFGVQLPLKGILFGLGAALGQGVGLVLSKIGLDCYETQVPEQMIGQMADFLPVGSNLIRCVAGLFCYAAWLYVMNLKRKPEERMTMRGSLKEKTGLFAMLLAVMSGPFIGVGFSLMAVQYTAAGIASTLMATTPILILLPSYWLFHQRITVRNVLGAVISVVGVSLFFL